VILGVARAVGETAPIVLTAFGADQVNVNPFSGPQTSLPLFAFRLLRQPNERQINRGWAALLLLVLIVLVLFLLARFIGSRADKRLGRRR
jgi:phosphate transport system permease protein